MPEVAEDDSLGERARLIRRSEGQRRVQQCLKALIELSCTPMRILCLSSKMMTNPSPKKRVYMFSVLRDVVPPGMTSM